MIENIFYFGDMLFLQINGTAIETPCTIIYTNLYTDRKKNNNNQKISTITIIFLKI